MADSNDVLQQYYPWLRKTAGNLIGFDDPWLDDLIQEGYIAMWRAYQDYDPDRGPLVPRLLYCARKRMVNVAYGAHRYTGHEPARGHAEAKSPLHYDELPDREYVMPVTRDDPYVEPSLTDALAALPPKQRAYVFLRFWIANGAFGRTPSVMRLREQYPLLGNDKLWLRARDALRKDPRVRVLAGLPPVEIDEDTAALGIT
jgi:DNA-directed RNA polymerase specialized sigma24 family protein